MDAIQVIFLNIIILYIITMLITSLIVNLLNRKLNMKKDFNHQPKVSVLISAFNESEAVYHTIKSLRNNKYPTELLEIIAFDDRSSDDTYEWLLKAAKDFPNVIVQRNEVNKGKGLTVVDAARVATGSFIVGVDSDCIFADNAIAELMACFTEPKIGAVGGLVKVMNSKESLLARAQAVFYANSYFLFKKLENSARKVQCLSGPIVAMRKETFLELAKHVEARSFFGLRITNGEDRALTQILLRSGYDTYINYDARCWTNVPTKPDQYLKQQLRWRKSAIGQWAEAIGKWRQYTPVSFCFSILPVSVTLIWMTLVFTSLFTLNFLPVLISILLIHLAMAPVFAIVYWWVNKDDPFESVRDPVPFLGAMLIAAFWFPISGLLVGLFAACSLDDGSWITRTDG